MRRSRRLWWWSTRVLTRSLSMVGREFPVQCRAMTGTRSASLGGGTWSCCITPEGWPKVSASSASGPPSESSVWGSSGDPCSFRCGSIGSSCSGPGEAAHDRRSRVSRLRRRHLGDDGVSTGPDRRRLFLRGAQPPRGRSPPPGGAGVADRNRAGPRPQRGAGDQGHRSGPPQAGLLVRPSRDHRHQRRLDGPHRPAGDRKSTRLNSSHLVISYAVFCLKKKKKKIHEVIFLSYKCLTYECAL